MDPEVFSRRLVALKRYLERIASFRGIDEATFLREPSLHDLAERYLHLAMEACLDLGAHWVAERDLRAPETYRSTFSILAEAKAIEEPLAERLASWAGLRNVLVHDYLDIDHRISFRAIREALEDLEAFRLAAVAELDRSEGDAPPE